jgi:hypothetical protein
MKKILMFISVFAFFSLSAMAQTKKDGTPDMRYKANRQSYSTPSYSAPKQNTQRNYSNGGQYRVQNGYQKQNGTYVAPHLKTTPDNKKWNNAKPNNF